MGIRSLIPTRDYLCSHIASNIPFTPIRMKALRALGINIGKNSNIFMKTEFIGATAITVGSNTVIGNHCNLDGRGGLSIGNNVNISSYTIIVSGSHAVQSMDFKGDVFPIVIEDYVWICTRATILPKVIIGKGAVVAAGSVVTRSIEPFTIVAGTPAKKIGERNPNLTYQIDYPASWI